MMRREAQNLNHKNRQEQVSAEQVNAKLESLLAQLLAMLEQKPTPTPAPKRTLVKRSVVCEGRPGERLHCHISEAK